MTKLCKEKMVNVACDKPVHVAMIALASLVLVDADRLQYDITMLGPVRPQHNPITMLGLGKRLSDRDTMRSQGTDTTPASDECVSENEQFVNFNPFLNGLLDSGETDDVEYDDYYDYMDETGCSQDEVGDIFCDYSEFTGITRDYCVDHGGVLYNLSGLENCRYNGDEPIEITTRTSNIFICLGSSCEIENVVHELNGDAEASWSETQCTFSLSYDGQTIVDNLQIDSSSIENLTVDKKSEKHNTSKGTKGNKENKGKSSKSTKKTKSKKDKKSTKKAPKRRN